jgi:BirA family biotin operon repressor/biotin-[acetyl-CoA-carboxylase] ligase
MKILEFEVLESTQKKAFEIAEKNFEPKMVILTKTQTGGIGRKGGKEGDFWWSPGGGLWFSIILPKILPEKLEIFTNLLSFLIAKVIFEETGEKIFIKFPNDLYFHEKKIGGVMVQNKICGKNQVSVAGIGINTNVKEFPKNLKNKATSIFLETKKEIDNKKFLEKILKEIDKILLWFQEK